MKVHTSWNKLQGTQKNSKLREAQLVEQLTIIGRTFLGQQVSRFSHGRQDDTCPLKWKMSTAVGTR
jgi:hypothetical protein